MISSKECIENHHIYDVDTKMGSAIFYNSENTDHEDLLIMVNQKIYIEEMKEEASISLEDREKWFTMHFDGACSKEGVGVGVEVGVGSLFCTNNYLDFPSFTHPFLYLSCF